MVGFKRFILDFGIHSSFFCLEIVFIESMASPNRPVIPFPLPLTLPTNIQHEVLQLGQFYEYNDFVQYLSSTNEIEINTTM